jgi:precorrin-8X/cobalt-precorrin-8 methylmutase
MLEQGAPKPALVVGIPVGFVGAAESKAALQQQGDALPHITVVGRRGGSAIAAAAINALASEEE